MTSLHRLIHGGFRQLGISDDADRRAVYLRVVSKGSLSDMTDPEKQLVADELRRLGYRPSAPRSSGREGKLPLDGKYLAKIRALWIALYNLGEVKDRCDSAMEEFALGRQVPHLDGIRFIHRAQDGQSVVDALKKWAERAGVNWSDVDLPPRDSRRATGYKIARAQWRLLYPAKEMQTETYFWIVVTDLLDLDETTRVLTDKQWIEVMNYLGKQVRALKKKTAL